MGRITPSGLVIPNRERQIDHSIPVDKMAPPPFQLRRPIPIYHFYHCRPLIDFAILPVSLFRPAQFYQRYPTSFPLFPILPFSRLLVLPFYRSYPFSGTPRYNILPFYRFNRVSAHTSLTILPEVPKKRPYRLSHFYQFYPPIGYSALTEDIQSVRYSPHYVAFPRPARIRALPAGGQSTGYSVRLITPSAAAIQPAGYILYYTTIYPP